MLKKRQFNGFVRQLTIGETAGENNFRLYDIEVVPWFWLLTKVSDSRVFCEKGIREIIPEVLDGFGYEYDLDLQKDYPIWEYCAQYRETTFNFLSRLFEQCGIFYFFRHSENAHQMVISDHAGAYDPCIEKNLTYAPAHSGSDVIRTWESSFNFHSGQWTQRDYNFETPQEDLEASQSTNSSLPSVSKFEMYDYPGEYSQQGEGENIAQVRMSQIEVASELIRGSSGCHWLSSGLSFDFASKALTSDDGQSFAIVSVNHFGAEGSYESGSAPHSEYYNHFTCVPERVVLLPSRSTPKPMISGTQTALVVGPSDKDINTDEYGRIQVQFHWDREGKEDGEMACWARVAQMWAGKNWGTMFIPRVGHEVVVTFLEGDPDRPLVIGSVYNKDNMPPYPLGAERTKSGIKSRSADKGGTDEFNELRFDDKKGSEEVYFHAERDFNRVVEEKDTLEVGKSQTEKIKDDRKVTIEQGNDSLKIDMGSHTTEAMQKIELKVGQNSITIDQSGITIKGLMVKIQAQTITEVKGSAMVKIQGGIVLVN